MNPQTTPRGQSAGPPTVCPRPAPSPRVNPSRAPAPSVCLPHSPSPRVNTNRSPPPSSRLSQAPSPRVVPRRSPAPGARLSQAPSPRVRSTRVPPSLGATPNQFQHPLDPLVQASPQHAAAQLDIGIHGTNLDVIQGDKPPRHRTRSKTAQHSAHSIPSIPMANAAFHPTTGANMEYRGRIADKETFPTGYRAAANEYGHLAQVFGWRVKGSNTIYFIPRSAVPPEKRSRMVALCWMCNLTNNKFIACD
jgi:hypothetical protein